MYLWDEKFCFTYILVTHQFMHDYIIKFSIASTESDASTSKNTKARI